MKLTNINTIKDLLMRHGFTFTKSLGQNFLINPSVCPRMAAAVTGVGNPKHASTGTVVEIGAGIGVLTRELSKVADKVIVIEIDETLKPILAETLADCDNVEIIWGDVLKLNLHEIITQPVHVCANLPYYAATHIIMQLLESGLPVRSITAMVQEEVAQRFTALPGSKQYGIVGVITRYFAEPKQLFKVSRGSFMPSPNVDSAVIQLIINNEQLIMHDEKKLFKLIKAAFSERRKQLCNPVSKEFGIEKEAVKAALEHIGMNSTARAEELGLNEFIKLYERILVE
ncbi:MAG: 16S rRNA (adenine(1518)-N(6)/adenine(1519)-N(6))-dimethyltransferase RsmA [Oscillospiraceae bacterium]|nr:16S rRNA (adenine(1518)-N(6)/adenine(1519)-N(6))-dimethyltransferase RsmA [Oscillospiraceae bacterium]